LSPINQYLDVPLPLTTHDRVAELHLDYNGHHAIVSTVTGENFYFNMKSLSLKPLKRLKVRYKISRLLSALIPDWAWPYLRTNICGWDICGRTFADETFANATLADATFADEQSLTWLVKPCSTLFVRKCLIRKCSSTNKATPRKLKKAKNHHIFYEQ